MDELILFDDLTPRSIDIELDVDEDVQAGIELFLQRLDEVLYDNKDHSILFPSSSSSSSQQPSFGSHHSHPHISIPSHLAANDHEAISLSNAAEWKHSFFPHFRICGQSNNDSTKEEISPKTRDSPHIIDPFMLTSPSAASAASFSSSSGSSTSRTQPTLYPVTHLPLQWGPTSPNWNEAASLSIHGIPKKPIQDIVEEQEEEEVFAIDGRVEEILAIHMDDSSDKSGDDYDVVAEKETIDCVLSKDAKVLWNDLDQFSSLLSSATAKQSIRPKKTTIARTVVQGDGSDEDNDAKKSGGIGRRRRRKKKRKNLCVPFVDKSGFPPMSPMDSMSSEVLHLLLDQMWSTSVAPTLATACSNAAWIASSIKPQFQRLVDQVDQNFVRDVQDEEEEEEIDEEEIEQEYDEDGFPTIQEPSSNPSLSASLPPQSPSSSPPSSSRTKLRRSLSDLPSQSASAISITYNQPQAAIFRYGRSVDVFDSASSSVSASNSPAALSASLVSSGSSSHLFHSSHNHPHHSVLPPSLPTLQQSLHYHQQQQHQNQNQNLLVTSMGRASASMLSLPSPHLASSNDSLRPHSANSMNNNYSHQPTMTPIPHPPQPFWSKHPLNPPSKPPPPLLQQQQQQQQQQYRPSAAGFTISAPPPPPPPHHSRPPPAAAVKNRNQAFGATPLSASSIPASSSSPQQIAMPSSSLLAAGAGVSTWRPALQQSAAGSSPSRPVSPAAPPSATGSSSSSASSSAAPAGLSGSRAPVRWSSSFTQNKQQSSNSAPQASSVAQPPAPPQLQQQFLSPSISLNDISIPGLLPRPSTAVPSPVSGDVLAFLGPNNHQQHSSYHSGSAAPKASQTKDSLRNIGTHNANVARSTMHLSSSAAGPSLLSVPVGGVRASTAHSQTRDRKPSMQSHHHQQHQPPPAAPSKSVLGGKEVAFAAAASSRMVRPTKN